MSVQQDAAARYASPIIRELEAIAVRLDPALEQLIASQIRSAAAVAAKVAELAEAGPG